jgi:hypothetical protein
MEDIRPPLGDILDAYERLTYKSKSAISEFVDNSTASYFSNKVYLNKLHSTFMLEVNIIYDPKEKIITISDNAMGMNKEELYNALRIARRPSDTNGRNEFGMGLKTAASWFSKKWEVITKKADSRKSYSVFVDINDLRKTRINDFIVNEKYQNDNSHYTIVRLIDINRNLNSKTVDALKDEIASIYRKDLMHGDIVITFNNQKLTFQEEEIFIDKTDGTNEEKKVLIDTFVEHNKEKYFIKGFIGILKNGSYKHGGLTLLRRNRVIIGGIGNNYKPYDLFKSANSFSSLRVFGEISLNNWPVTQAKDAFDWETNGLEELFIAKIYQLAKPIFLFAQKSQKQTEPPKPLEINPDNLLTFQGQTVEALNAIQSSNIEASAIIQSKDVFDMSKMSYQLKTRIGSKKYLIDVIFQKFDDSQLFMTEYNNDKIWIKINTLLPIFKEFRENIDLFSIVQKFIVLLIISESWIKETNSHPEGLAKPEEIRETLNSIINQIEETGGSYEEV